MDSGGFFLADIPHVPRLVHVSRDLLFVLRIAENKTVFVAVFREPDSLRAVAEGEGQFVQVKGQTALVLRVPRPGGIAVGGFLAVPCHVSGVDVALVVVTPIGGFHPQRQPCRLGVGEHGADVGKGLLIHARRVTFRQRIRFVGDQNPVYVGALVLSHHRHGNRIGHSGILHRRGGNRAGACRHARDHAVFIHHGHGRIGCDPQKGQIRRIGRRDGGLGRDGFPRVEGHVMDAERDSRHIDNGRLWSGSFLRGGGVGNFRLRRSGVGSR